jgi:LysR family transcriptional regulator of gallate degradation
MPSTPFLPPHLKKLRAVRAVAASGSTARAAEVLHLSQPAVTRAVRDVERTLELQVFERNARGMALTEGGRVLTARLERSFTQLAAADRQLSLLAAGHRLGSTAKSGQIEAQAGHKHLAVWTALAAAGSELRCAEAMGLSQSAVCQAVGELEHLAGVRLFHRSARGMRLTEPGESALRHVKLALFELDNATADLAAHRGVVAGSIVVGILPFSTGLFLPRAVEQVLSAHPEVTIKIVDGTYETLLHRLRHAELDMVVGALRQPPPPGDLTQHALFDDALAVTVRHGHPLLRRRLRGLRDLSRGAWILPMPNSPAREAFDRAFAAEGLPPPASGLQVNSPALTQTLLLESDRMALMSPRQLVHELRAGLLAVLPVRVRHTARAIGLTTRSGDAPSPAVRHLIEALREAASRLEGPDGG